MIEQINQKNGRSCVTELIFLRPVKSGRVGKIFALVRSNLF